MDLRRLKRMLTVDDSILESPFALSDPSKSDEPSADRAQTRGSGLGAARYVGGRMRLRRMRVAVGEQFIPARAPDSAADQEDTAPVRRVYARKDVQPFSYSELRSRVKSLPVKGGDAREFAPAQSILMNLAENRQTINRVFNLPANKDIVVREFATGRDRELHGLLVFVDGLVDKNIINSHILEPLMLLSRYAEDKRQRSLLQWIDESLVPGNQTSRMDTWKEAIGAILAGSTVLFFDGVGQALAVETKGWEHRMVTIPQTETVVRGPHDAFTENFRSNTGLIRAKLRSPDLVTEILQVGRLAQTDIAILYIKGLTNDSLVAEVRRRIRQIDVDYLPIAGLVEQFIGDPPVGIVPKVLSTERPDRVAFGLTEGQVAILVGHSSFALLAPTVIWSLLQTPEDAYLQFPFGLFLRGVRALALVFALLLPAFYIAVANYHPEMIPTDLMIAVAAAREKVPFPVVVEVLVMEFAIELIREAGVRIPSVIGPTIGIVGALILGQAAVAAGIISPLLIIVVAVTALGSFTMPNYTFSFSVRILRFGFILAAGLFGFYGIILGILALVMHVATLRSFGVPMLSPVAPRQRSSPDTLWRSPAFAMDVRPSMYMPQRMRRQFRPSGSAADERSGADGGAR